MPILEKIAKNLRRSYEKTPHLLLRRTAQVGTAFIFIVAAWQFTGFVGALGGGAQEAHRPPVVEGFLPVAAITALNAYLATGVFDPIHPAGLVLLMATLATAFLFRRALCSWLCPIGFLSEMLAKEGKKIFKRSFPLPKWLDYSLLGVKYALLAWLFNLFFLMPPEQAVSFMRLPYYAISDVKMFEFFASAGAKTFIAILVVAALSLLVKSFWCRYLCPYGALLGVLGLFSPLILKRDGEKCTKCGVCNASCHMGVDVMGKKALVISPECSGCGSCAGGCPGKGALEFKFLGLFKAKPVALGLLFLCVFFGTVYLAKFTGRWESSMGLEEYRAIYRMMGRH